MKPHGSEFAAARADAAARSLKAANAHFQAGRLHAAADAIKEVDAEAANAIAAGKQRDFLLYGLAAYGLGDKAEAIARHRLADPLEHSALRYRMLIELGEFAEALKLRRAGPYPPKVEADFRWTLSRAALWSGRMGRGLRLYDARVNAEHFSRILPGWLDHNSALSAGLAPPAVTLEQGIGDTLFHIMQMKTIGVAPQRIFGQSRHRKLVATLWPRTQFHELSAGPPEGVQLTETACSADWLWRRWRRDRTIGGLPPLKELAAGASAPRAGFGVCWRGGSGQNRREQREIPLQFFLDLLPKGPGYVALQHDLTADEKRLLSARPDITVPDFDMVGDDLGLARAIARLSGVITVDSANAHFAGAVGAPLLLLMNERPHWYWGPDARADYAYPGAQTLPISQLRRQQVEHWLAMTAAPAKRRSRAPASSSPIFITGAPRSRTSMVAGSLAAGGLIFGDTIGPTSENPSGFVENRQIREAVLKPLLSRSGFDPLGVRSLPPLGWNPPAPGLNDAIAAALGEAMQSGLWGYKDPKLLLLWRRFSRAYPDAHWLVVERPVEAVVDSCLRTSFMRKHARHPDYWRHFVRSYAMRADDLATCLGASVMRVNSDILAATHTFPAPLRSRLSDIGVDMNAAEAFLAETSAQPG